MIDIRKIKHGYWWDSQGKFESLINNENRLKEITIQITDKCNMACLKCNRINFTFEDMKTDDILRIINEACELGLKHIHFTGGEPTLHPDFVEILKICRSKDLRIDMSTNGKFDIKLAKQIVDAGINSINISWDFIDIVPQCIDFIFNFSVDIFLNHMVMPSNYKELPSFLLHIKKNYSKIIDIQLMPPRGSAEKFTKEQIEDFKNTVALCAQIYSEDRFPMVKEKVSTMLDYEADKGIYHQKIEWPCHRSKSELRVGSKGFTTCTYLYRDGHVTCGLDKSVKEAWEMCKIECQGSPPIKEMCDLSCSPEVSSFNQFVEIKFSLCSNY